MYATRIQYLAAGPLGVTMLLRLHHRYGATDNQRLATDIVSLNRAYFRLAEPLVS